MEYLADYGVFLAKTVTLLLLVVVVLALAFRALKQPQKAELIELEVSSLNERFDGLRLALEQAVLPPKRFKRRIRQREAEDKSRLKARDSGKEQRKRIFVLRFQGDIQASAVHSLREEISALLQVAATRDEVLLLLDSQGGTVHDYGLAAAQLRRIRDRNIPLTAAVDRVAASGGYLMASVAERIVAAPFAIIGSIGVIAQIPNFNRVLKNLDIDFEQITAGEYKRTLTMFGENTDKGRNKARQDIELTHDLFKQFVQSQRPQLDIQRVATGETWYGNQALELQLIDEVVTSDDYLLRACTDADVYLVRYHRPMKPLERLFKSPGQAIWRQVNRFLNGGHL